MIPSRRKTLCLGKGFTHIKDHLLVRNVVDIDISDQEVTGPANRTGIVEHFAASGLHLNAGPKFHGTKKISLHDGHAMGEQASVMMRRAKDNCAYFDTTISRHS